jgi:nicotinate-nucleotide pyrophosphorylase (carboxylating)
LLKSGKETTPLNTSIKTLIKAALSEDLPSGDITTEALIYSKATGSASFKVKLDGVIAGTEVAASVFNVIDPRIKTSFYCKDGDLLMSGTIFGKVEGKVTGILKGERTALNFLQHLSGIATQTHLYVEAVKNLPVILLDTRKTIPGLRILEKEAVKAGGGTNHRMNLSDAILIKDNHIKLLIREGLSLALIIDRAKKNNPRHLKIEVEVRTLEEAAEAVQAGADRIMLDNMDIQTMKKTVIMINNRAETEASGNVTLQNVRQVAETGVDFISIGALTHSANALDISLKLD